MLEIVIAFGAGLISFLSPCVLPLIPGYVSYVTGNSIQEFTASKNVNLIPIILFTVGFSIVFIFFGAAATFIGKRKKENNCVKIFEIKSLPALKKRWKKLCEHISFFKKSWVPL